MSESVAKYAKLVDMLWDKTKAGKIPWDFDANRQTITVWNGDVLLTVNRSEDENYEDVYTVSLLNRAGVYLENFNDVALAEINAGEGFKNYFVKLRELYDLAMRRATGADKALDDFIQALERDDLGIPF